MTDTTVIDDTDTPADEPAPPHRWAVEPALIVRRLAVVVIVAVALSFVPEPVRGYPMVAWCVFAPAALWAILLHDRVLESWLYSCGLGTILTLAGWAFVEFLLLLARAGVNPVSGIACLLIISIVPAVFAQRATLSRPRFGDRTMWTVIVFGLLLVGTVLLSLSMILARRNPSTPPIVFAVFWIAMLVMYVPMFVRIIWTRYPEIDEWPLAIALGTGTYLPYLVRAPNHPYLNDEYAHWGETVRMIETGRLFLPDSVLDIGGNYPGLQTMASAITDLSGLPTISVGRALILVCHVCSVVGVAALARRLGASPRGALVAAALYAISPSMIQIDNMFSYESFAVPMAIWFAVCVLSLAYARDRVWLGAGLTLGVALVITHHLTTIGFGVVLIVLGLVSTIRKPRVRRTWSVPLIAGAALLVAELVWSSALGSNLGTYLGNFVGFAGDGIKSALGLGDRAGTTAINDGNGMRRQIFADSVLPGYERGLSLAAQPLLFIWFAYAVRRVGRRISGPQLGIVLLGLAYFVSLPLTLVGGASAAAHRSWATSFVGVAVIAGLALDRGKPTHLRRGSARTAALWSGAAVVVLTVAMFGAYSGGSNVYTRFPGPFFLGADGRTVTPDMVRAAEWFRRTQGPERNIITNARTVTIFGSYGQALTPNFPRWQLFFPTTFDRTVVREFLATDIDYVVVDRRLATVVPRDSYFVSYEPAPPSVPLPHRSIDKFAKVPWLHQIHRDHNIVIYRVDRAAGP